MARHIIGTIQESYRSQYLRTARMDDDGLPAPTWSEQPEDALIIDGRENAYSMIQHINLDGSFVVDLDHEEPSVAAMRLHIGADFDDVLRSLETVPQWPSAAYSETQRVLLTTFKNTVDGDIDAYRSWLNAIAAMLAEKNHPLAAIAAEWANDPEEACCLPDRSDALFAMAREADENGDPASGETYHRMADEAAAEEHQKLIADIRAGNI